MADYMISGADLRYIEKNLNSIMNQVGDLESHVKNVQNEVTNVNSNVIEVARRIDRVADDLARFVRAQTLANRLNQAHTRYGNLVQKLDIEYGHYAEVRRSATGILQAADTGLVKKELIDNVSGTLMVTTPRYWLAPCLVAITAWINDDRELADKAVNESLRRNPEKASLFFALVSRRAARKLATLSWIEHYLDDQDEENLNRATVTILDAYASGLFGRDQEGIVSGKIEKWMNSLEQKPNFVDSQIDQWSKAIRLKIQPLDSSEYPTLQTYSPTWKKMRTSLEEARLNEIILNYFRNIYSQKQSSEPLKVQLDNILNTLVSEFDEEETPLRKEARLEELVIQYKGDEDRAKKDMAVETKSFEERKNFTQLLTDAAMNPEITNSSPSTQKFAIALTNEWILAAYQDIVAKSRAAVPAKIELSLAGFKASTANGENEDEIQKNWMIYNDTEEQKALDQVGYSEAETIMMFLGIGMVVFGLLLTAGGAGGALMGMLLAIVGGILAVRKYSRKKSADEKKDQIREQFANQRKNGKQIIGGFMAQVVDYRENLKNEDAKSEEVFSFLEDLTSSEFINQLENDNRRIQFEGAAA